MNAIELLKQHHLNTKTALEEMCKTKEIDAGELRLLADELVAHMLIEEEIFYPRVQNIAPELVPESFEEHATARFELARLLLADAEHQIPRLTVLKELIDHHVKEEESSLFPKVQAQVSSEELESMGVLMEALFDRAVAAGLERVVVANTQELLSPDMQAGIPGHPASAAQAPR